MSYFFHAFLFSKDAPPAAAARDYLMEGELFDEDPEILIRLTPDGRFDEMRLNHGPGLQPIILRRLTGIGKPKSLQGSAGGLVALRQG